MFLCSAPFIDPRFKLLLFVLSDYTAEVHGNIKQQAIALTNSESSTEASDEQAAGPGVSRSGSASKKCKHHDKTWSVILGPKKVKEKMTVIYLHVTLKNKQWISILRNI